MSLFGCPEPKLLTFIWFVDGLLVGRRWMSLNKLIRNELSSHSRFVNGCFSATAAVAIPAAFAFSGHFRVPHVVE